MKKERLLLIVLLGIIIIAVVIGIRLTGKVVLIGGNSVTRTSESKGGFDLVKLAIKSNQNVIGIRENFTENCSVINYSISVKYDVTEFNGENEWIIADKNKTINAELSYYTQKKCAPEYGDFFIVENGVTKSFEISKIGLCKTNSDCVKTCSEYEKYCSGNSLYKKRTCDVGKCSGKICVFKKSQEKVIDKKCDSSETCLNLSCVKTCIDSDVADKNRGYVKGKVSYLSRGKYLIKEDYCGSINFFSIKKSLSQKSLIEYYCNAGKVAYKQIKCLNGCKNGACVK